MINKLMEALKRGEDHARRDIEAKMQQTVLEETVDYVIQNMGKAHVRANPFEVYDYVLYTQELIEGLYCELGVFQATSINYVAKKIKTNIHGFDSFEGLPEFWYGEYEKGAFDLKGQLPSVEPNVILHKGWFNDNIPQFIHKYKEPLAFLHVDCDLYSSTKTIFNLM
ncbi:MAG: hypothetical protein C4329_03915 [Chitinophagaceae bacterium]